MHKRPVLWKYPRVYQGMKWEEKEGYQVPRLESAPVRHSEKMAWSKNNWSQEDEDQLGKLREAVSKDKARYTAIKEGSEIAKQQRIADNESAIKLLEERRAPVTSWETSMIRKCYYGSKAMLGSHFFYYNFGYIESIKGGSTEIILPNYRQVDNLVSRALESAVENKRGVIFIKRRRLGMTWRMVGFVLYTMLFKHGSVFFTTHSETDIKKFISRVKKMIERLPDFLKPEVIIANNLLSIEFKPPSRITSVLGLDELKIPYVSINTAAPTSLPKFEGGGKALFLVDEAGLTPNLSEILSAGKPMLAGEDGISREGALFIFGTVGDMATSGGTFKKIWKQHKSHRIDQFFLKAQYGHKMDNAGNDLMELSNSILDEEIALFEEDGAIQEKARFVQLYPRTIDDAFMSSKIMHPWPSAQIQMAEDDMAKWEKVIKYGLFRRSPEGKVEFMRQEPNFPPKGHVGNQEGTLWPGYNQMAIIESPVASNWLFPYAAGMDPTPFYKNVGKGPQIKHSDLSFVITKRHESIGDPGGYPVCLYHGRPDRVTEVYAQVILALEYYDCKVNVERNKGGSDVYQFFDANGRLDLLAFGTGIASKYSTSDRNYGFANTERWWANMISVGENWWTKYQHTPVPVIQRFVDESWMIGEKGKNTDLMVAWLAAEQLSIEYTARENGSDKRYKEEQDQEYNPNPWRFGKDGMPIHVSRMNRR